MAIYTIKIARCNSQPRSTKQSLPAPLIVQAPPFCSKYRAKRRPEPWPNPACQTARHQQSHQTLAYTSPYKPIQKVEIFLSPNEMNMSMRNCHPKIKSTKQAKFVRQCAHMHGEVVAGLGEGYQLCPAVRDQTGGPTALSDS